MQVVQLCSRDTPTQRRCSGANQRADFGEELAPEKQITCITEIRCFSAPKRGDQPSRFPDVPWATEVAKFTDLTGQLIVPGKENGSGLRLPMDDTVPKVEGFAFDMNCSGNNRDPFFGNMGNG